MIWIGTRPATEADTAFARLAHHAAYRDVVERQFGAWEHSSQDAFFAADWRPLEMEVILADNVACGYWAVEDRDDDIHIRELVIHPDWQGQGIGSELLRRLQRHAIDRGLPIRLGTLHSSRAIGLYERLGFRRFDQTDTHVLMAWSPPMPGSATTTFRD